MSETLGEKQRQMDRTEHELKEKKKRAGEKRDQVCVVSPLVFVSVTVAVSVARLWGSACAAADLCVSALHTVCLPSFMLLSS